MFFFPISKFSYKLIRFLLNSSIVKSDNEMGKFFYQNMQWLSPPVISFFIISKFSYKLISFLVNSSIGKSDNEM